MQQQLAKNIYHYRPISLTSNISKIFCKLIKNRIYPTLNGHLSKGQAGFRKGFSTVDHLFTVNQIIEKAKEYKFPLYLMFIDYNKVFDSIYDRVVWETLRKQGVEQEIVHTLENWYKQSKAYVPMARNGRNLM